MFAGVRAYARACMCVCLCSPAHLITSCKEVALAAKQHNQDPLLRRMWLLMEVERHRCKSPLHVSRRHMHEYMSTIDFMLKKVECVCACMHKCKVI